MQLILIVTFIAIGFAYYFMQKDRIRREERRERMRRKQQELLDRITPKEYKDEQNDN